MEISLSDLVAVTGGEIAGDPRKTIRGIAPFETAGSNDITFADTAKLLKKLAGSKAGAVIVPRDCSQPAGTNLVYSDAPRLAFARALYWFYPKKRPPAPGISPRACIGGNFQAGPDVCIGAMAVIEDNVSLGARVWIHPGAVIAEGVQIGDDTEVYPNATILSGCRIGCRVVIHSGSVIGSDGYGFVPEQGRHFKIPQVGVVQIDDDVEIGACNCIDRATFGRTWIKSGVKTDNQVHIGHNVTIGENSLLVAKVGIAGSVEIGRNVTLAGQAGVGGHIQIGDNAVIGPQAGVTRSVPEGRVVSGTPEMPHRQWLKVCRIIPRLPELKKRVDRLEAGMKKLTGRSDDKEQGTI
ncbi:MAG: UDP-3-O-(3-hydroxymyristoyl)glucosamine N-acyltransferase [Desulfosalsimonadaceae bacterium]